jgi:hypothetical protein
MFLTNRAPTASPKNSGATNQNQSGCNFRARPAAMEPLASSFLQASFDAMRQRLIILHIYMQYLWDEHRTSLYFGFFEPTQYFISLRQPLRFYNDLQAGVTRHLD